MELMGNDYEDIYVLKKNNFLRLNDKQHPPIIYHLL